MSDAMIEMKVGDFAVEQGRWHTDAHEVRRVTNKCYWSASRWSSGDHRYDRAHVIFAGPESVAKKLLEQLRSSQAQLDEDTRNAAARRAKRDEGFLAAAQALLPREREKE